MVYRFYVLEPFFSIDQLFIIPTMQLEALPQHNKHSVTAWGWRGVHSIGMDWLIQPWEDPMAPGEA